ncbi:MAG: PAS domain S-box protein [Methanobacterium sp.]|uniref:PAS domain S-box protein n=1 Tax=Methanobacterium sp. TaxID=2164 RepID=UPI003D649787|nr:PAS domain S-box protein [Methanobacterium sp.]
MSKTKIILVEDDAIEAMDIKHTLESFGFEVPFVASRGEEAVEKSLDIMPDLVIMDIVLKGEMNGIEAAEEIVKLHIPIIYLSAHSDEPTVEKAKLTGPYGYIIKPYGPNELRYAIELALYKNKMERDLRNSQRQLSAIIDGSPVLQFVIDKNHYVIHWNQAMAEYSGISSEEIIGTDEHWRAFYSEKRPCLADLIVDEDIKVLDKWYSGKYKESEHLKGAYVAEDFFPSIGETGKWLHFTAASIKDAEGNIIGALETLEDITERKEAENSLKINEERLKIALQGANAAIFDWSIPTGEAYFSPEYYQLFGYEADEFPANYDSWSKLIHVDDREKTLANLKKQIEDKLDNFKIEYRVICKNKSIKWILGVAKGLEFDENGIATRIIGMNQDITERKTIEERLKLTQFSVEHGPDSIIWITSDARICFVNEAACESLGYSNEELISMTVFDIDPDFPQEEWEEHWKDIKSGKIKTVETKHRKKNGEKFYVNISINYLKYNGTEYNCAFVRDVTPQKEVEMDLQESQRRLETLISNLPGIVYRCKNDAEWTMEFVSEGCLELTGYSTTDLIGNRKLSYGSLIHPEDLQKVWDDIQIALDKKEHYEIIYRIIAADSQIKFVWERGRGVFSSSGELLFLEGFIEDITERREAEESLKDSEGRFRALTENSLDTIMLFDSDLRHLYVNPNVEKDTGIPADEFIGKTHAELGFPEDLVEIWENTLLNVFQIGKTDRIEFQLPNGVWMDWLMIPLFSDGGKVKSVITSARDITERKKAEESIKEQYHFLQNLIDTIPYPLFYKDKEYVYIGCNNAFEEFIGLSKDEIVGKNVYDISPKDLADKYHQKDKELFENQILQVYEAPVQYADGSRHTMLFNKAIFEDKDGELAGLIGVMVDITERKETEEALKHSEVEYRAIFENSKSAVAVYTAVDNGENFVLNDFNKAAEEIEQIKREDVIDKRVTEVFPGVKEFGIFEVFKRVWKTGKPEKYPVSLYKDARIEGWRENYIYKLPSSDIVAVYDDLTEIKQYEEELEQNQVRLKSLVRILQYKAESVQDFLDYALNEAIQLTESKLGFIYHYYEDKKEFVLDSASRDDRKDVSGIDYNMIYKLENVGIWGEAVRQRKPLILNDFESDNPLKKSYPEGHAFIHKFMNIPVFSEDKIVAVVGLANKDKDYTEIDVLQIELLMESVWKVLDVQQAEDALKKSEARYKAIFENTGSAMAISEKDMTLSLVNEEFAQFTGYSKEKIENKMSWTNFFVEEELPKMKEYHQLRRIEPDKVPANYESRVMDIEGNIKDVYMSVAMIPGTKKSVVSLLDITEKKQSRIKLRKELEINRSLARIYVPIISPESSMEDVTVAILGEARKLTKSKYGFVSSIDTKTGENILHSLSSMMMECEVMWEKNEVVSFHVGSDGIYPGLWGHCLNTKESFYTNNAQKHPSAKGVPEGHVKLEKFLGIPVLIDNEVAGEIALANPVNDYSDDDINVVERIAEFFAMAIQRKKYEDQIKNSLDEKVLLLREIHHRVKNNLQIISSILNLQSSAVKDKYLVDVFKQNRNRIKAMAMIHEKLYNAPDLAKIDFSDYIRSLTTDITYTYLVKTEFLDIKLDLEDNIMLNIETAIPCGLILSELISNSIKHAFTEGVKGEIKIAFKKIDEKFILTLSDNGTGLPDELDFRKTESLGLQLVNSLVEQLDGSIELDKTKGTKFIIKFKELKYKKRI